MCTKCQNFKARVNFITIQAGQHAFPSSSMSSMTGIFFQQLVEPFPITPVDHLAGRFLKWCLQFYSSFLCPRVSIFHLQILHHLSRNFEGEYLMKEHIHSKMNCQPSCISFVLVQIHTKDLFNFAIFWCGACRLRSAHSWAYLYIFSKLWKSELLFMLLKKPLWKKLGRNLDSKLYSWYSKKATASELIALKTFNFLCGS